MDLSIGRFSASLPFSRLFMSTTTAAMEEAFGHFAQDDLTTGIAIIQREANKGELNAIFTMGIIFHRG